MPKSATHDARIATLTFASVYPHYLAKVEKKGRTREELHRVIEWLTGFDEERLRALIDEKATFETFFERATLNPNAHLITGMICGYRVEDIGNPLTRQVRYLDKLVDELAKGRPMDTILRTQADPQSLPAAGHRRNGVGPAGARRATGASPAPAAGRPATRRARTSRGTRSG